jgi:hypothetical protein
VGDTARVASTTEFEERSAVPVLDPQAWTTSCRPAWSSRTHAFRAPALAEEFSGADGGDG